MKAIVVHRKGENPLLEKDHPLPVQVGSNESLLNIKAVAIKNLDKIRASGEHYSLKIEEGRPITVGTDGVGYLNDGTLVYAMAGNGILAEKAWVRNETLVPLPKNMNLAKAAALPNAAMGSAIALEYRAKIKAGETILINGATGVTGKMAVQLAKLYGAKTVIATGRNEEALASLTHLGADHTLQLKDADGSLITRIKDIHKNSPIDIVIDYLWGHPAELILSALKSPGVYTHRTRFVTVGAMAGTTLPLASDLLRSTDLQLLGSGLGTWTKAAESHFFNITLPKIFEWAVKGQITLDTITIGMEQVPEYWEKDLKSGQRLVVLL